MSLLTDLFSQLGQNYTVNSQGDEQQRQEQIAREREAYLARLQQQAQLGQDPYWGQTQVGQAEAQKAQQELDKVLALRAQNYPTTAGQQLAETVGMIGSEVQQGAPLRRALTPPDATPGQKKAIAGGSQLVSMLGQALVGGRLPLPEGAPKSLPKPMSIVPEETGLIAKASGAKPIYGAAQKAGAKAGATASPQELRSFTNAQANAGGDVGAAIKDAAAKPTQGPVLPKGAEKALKQEAKTPVAQASATPTTEANAPKTKWQQVKKGAGTLSKAIVPAGLGYGVGRAWNDANAQVAQQAQPAPANPAFDPTFSALNYEPGPSVVDQFTQKVPTQKEPSFLEKLLQQVLTQNSQGQQRDGSLTEEQLLARMEGMMNQPQQPPPQVPDGKPTSTLGMIMDALGRGLIAGGTGQADPDAAQKLEMERMVTNQNLAQNARKLTPQQEMTMQMLQTLLGNKLNQGNLAQQGAQSQNNALIQAIVTSQLNQQENQGKYAYGAQQGELDRASAERIAGTRSAAAAQKAAAIQQFLESLNLGGAQVPAGPQVNFGQ